MVLLAFIINFLCCCLYSVTHSSYSVLVLLVITDYIIIIQFYYTAVRIDCFMNITFQVIAVNVYNVHNAVLLMFSDFQRDLSEVKAAVNADTRI